MEPKVTSAQVGDVRQLVSAARSGDGDAWRELVDRYSGMLRSKCLAYRLNIEDARDVVQTTWMLAVEHLGQLRSDEHLGGWLAAIANRECLKVLRRGSRETASGDLGEVDRPDGHLPTPEREVAKSWLVRVLPDVVGQLSTSHRLLLEILVATPDLPYADVARLTGRPVGSIGPTRSRCLARLRDMLVAREVDGAFLN